MKYFFKIPEMPFGKDQIINLKEAVEGAIKYWERVRDGNGYDWEKRLYTAQTLEPEFIEANLLDFNTRLKILNSRLK